MFPRGAGTFLAAFFAGARFPTVSFFAAVAFLAGVVSFGAVACFGVSAAGPTAFAVSAAFVLPIARFAVPAAFLVPAARFAIPAAGSTAFGVSAAGSPVSAGVSRADTASGRAVAAPVPADRSASVAGAAMVAGGLDFPAVARRGTGGGAGSSGSGGWNSTAGAAFARRDLFGFAEGGAGSEAAGGSSGGVKVASGKRRRAPSAGSRRVGSLGGCSCISMERSREHAAAQRGSTARRRPDGVAEEVALPPMGAALYPRAR
ncbi:hypothetical protein D7044_22795 [Micromonospora musae]|uniref:Uncharacterized protein n=1 Tax=Micromonospora musae TaxID=1894970 RepID=A0A3A9XX11_9ACTN|nr:hypothetical protein D7044_22795 [Micromonospora musae]